MRGKILGWILIWFKTVVSTNSTLLFVVALLGATVCADMRDAVSSKKDIASTRRGRMAEAMAALDGGKVLGEVQKE